MTAIGDLGDYWLGIAQEIVQEVDYKDWSFVVGRDNDGAPFLQIQFLDENQTPAFQRCRKWMLYRTMNASEVVRTAWMAVLAAEEHEARERFTYRGRRVMTPHIDFDAIVERGGLPVATTEDPR